MKCDKKWMPLYAVTDRAWLGERTLAGCVEETMRGGATCLQLREKELDDAAFLEEAKELKALCSRYGVPFIVNDNVDVGILSGADGVHVGQSDANADAVRARIGQDMILGVSVQTVEQAVKAEKDGADYLGVGAMFSTGTKLDADDVSFDTLREICKAVSIPVVAIGGISLKNIGAFAGTGIDGVAVVSAIFAAEQIEDATRKLRSVVREALGV